jgi:flagellin-like hook-associated protein FlgL
VETAAQAVSTFKEKGRAEMCKVLQKGISGMKSMLSGYRERLVDVMTDCEKTANQIDSIGDELKQIGNSVSNVGRLLAGKGTKEVSDEKPGVGLTRAVNTPVKKAVENLRKKIDGADQAFEKLDRLSARLDAGKEAEKGGRVSVKDKLSQMKEKAGQQKKAPEPDKAKSKEECL